MRMSYLLAAAALLAAGPALAQNATDANAAVADYPSENGMTAENAADAMAVDANAVAVDTVAVEEEAAPEPAQPKKRAFPWGVLGLLGLAGLIGRKR